MLKRTRTSIIYENYVQYRLEVSMKTFICFKINKEIRKIIQNRHVLTALCSFQSYNKTRIDTHIYYTKYNHHSKLLFFFFPPTKGVNIYRRKTRPFHALLAFGPIYLYLPMAVSSCTSRPHETRKSIHPCWQNKQEHQKEIQPSETASRNGEKASLTHSPKAHLRIPSLYRRFAIVLEVCASCVRSWRDARANDRHVSIVSGLWSFVARIHLCTSPGYIHTSV